jgi:hypothetical protein
MRVFQEKEKFKEKMQKVGEKEKQHLSDYRKIHLTMRRMIQEGQLLKRANYYLTVMILAKWKQIVQEEKMKKNFLRVEEDEEKCRYGPRTQKWRDIVKIMLDFKERCRVSLEEIYHLGLIKEKMWRILRKRKEEQLSFLDGEDGNSSFMVSSWLEVNQDLAKLSQNLFNIVPSNNFKVFYETLKKSTRVHKFVKNEKNENLLHFALRRSSPKFIGQLLEMQLDLDSKNEVKNKGDFLNLF